MRFSRLLFTAALAAAANTAQITSCPGYKASNVVHSGSTITANLNLAGPACDVYGKDLDDLRLLVEYQTDSRLHIKIYDAAEQVYQVPVSVLDPPKGTTIGSTASSALKFQMAEDPFAFSIVRTENEEVIFDTAGTPLVFESQYVRLRTSLPDNPNLYGLGEDTDPFRLNTTEYTRTLWSRDAYQIPVGTNLYGNHPIYFDHRQASGKTHGVYLHNSNGMDIKINNTKATGQYLEYNTVGGVIDLYVLAGPGPSQVAQQYSEVVGKAAMMPYWGLGFHQCKYGYQDYIELAEVVLNYSLAKIPLETMWTDIDYMDGRKIFTLDPLRFPLQKMREFVDYLHHHDQHYIVMVDPAVAYQDYDAFNNGVKAGAFLNRSDGSIYQGVVWPGVTAFPDWFAPGTQDYWNYEFDTFFSAKSGIDIDALWIDMNEASNFCVYPCTNATDFAVKNGFPPKPPPLRTDWEPLPGFPKDFQPPRHSRMFNRQNGGPMQGLPGRDLINPQYMISNAAGSLSNHTINTDLIHANGLAEYDVHNLYGTMMSSASREALLSRRPSVRPLVITRSTFAGAGAKVGHWLGDNSATWHDYRISIAQIIAFSSIFQVPMVGADVCGYAHNTTEALCARWAMLGAFYPFYRDHAASDVIGHEFYRWPSVTEAAQVAIKARYQLLDYFYTALQKQSDDGTPSLNALWFLYPDDPKTLGIDTQFFFGPSILVSPVTEENTTAVDIYLPTDLFYDFFTRTAVRGPGAFLHLANLSLAQIPVHIRGGAILPLRIDAAMTVSELRTTNFEVLIAPGVDGTAAGTLYLDDGESLVPKGVSRVEMRYEGRVLRVGGVFGYETRVRVERVTVLDAAGGGARSVEGRWGLCSGFEVRI